MFAEAGAAIVSNSPKNGQATQNKQAMPTAMANFTLRFRSLSRWLIGSSGDM